MIPAVIYAAKSTSDPNDSIGTQLQDGREIAEREGWEIAGEFRDEAFSAYSGPRGPALADALDLAERAAREHGEARFLIQHSDRLARGDGRTAPHLIEYVMRARRANVTIVSKQDAHTFSEDGTVYAAVGGDRANADSKRKAQAVSDGMARRRKKGLHTGGRERLGYQTQRDEYGRPAPGPRVLIPAEARIVRRIYDLTLAGVSQNEIARELNGDGTSTKRGGRWWQGTIARIVTDIYYAGYVSDDVRAGEPIKGEHDPIVTLEEWTAAQQITKQRRTTGDGKPGRTSSRPQLFTHGHLRCGYCGGAMGLRHKVRKHGDRTYSWDKYVCTIREHDAAACPMRPIDADGVEAMMLDELRRQPGEITRRVREAVAAIMRDRDNTADRLAEAERALADADDRVARVKRDYLAGDLPAIDYQEFKPIVEGEQAAAKAEVEQLRGRADRLQITLDQGELDDAVARVMGQIGEVLDDVARIDTTRNIIRSAWPEIVAYHDNGQVRLETADISDGFAQALSSTIEFDGLPLVSFVEQRQQTDRCKASHPGAAA